MGITLFGFAEPTHKAVARMTMATLAVGGDTDLGAYWGLAVVLRAKLTPRERQGLAWAALMASDDQKVLAAAKAILPSKGRADWPRVLLEEVVKEAVFWADHASPDKLGAYSAVCLSSLCPDDRTAFLAPKLWRAA